MNPKVKRLINYGGVALLTANFTTIVLAVTGIAHPPEPLLDWLLGITIAAGVILALYTAFAKNENKS